MLQQKLKFNCSGKYNNKKYKHTDNLNHALLEQARPRVGRLLIRSSISFITIGMRIFLLLPLLNFAGFGLMTRPLYIGQSCLLS
jgi:hypothetical protein